MEKKAQCTKIFPAPNKIPRSDQKGRHNAYVYSFSGKGKIKRRDCYAEEARVVKYRKTTNSGSLQIQSYE